MDSVKNPDDIVDFTKNLDKTMLALANDGAFLTSKTRNKINAMTIGWGYIGIMWGKPYFMAMIRPNRYTFRLVERVMNFTISVPFGLMKDELRICGTKSGEEINKGDIVNFIPSKAVASPIVAGCQMYYECKVNYSEKLDMRAIPQEVLKAHYNVNEYHYMYFGEIVDCYEGRSPFASPDEL